MLLSSIVLGASCTSMDHHYEEYWDLANRVYVGKVDSLIAHPGRNRVQLAWKKSPDPTVRDIAIYWNNGVDSFLTSTMILHPDGWLTTTVPELEEDTYAFQVYALDSAGNRSVPVEIVSRVYGDIYERGLVNRVARDIAVDGTSLTIWWFEDGDPTLIGTEIHYMDVQQVGRVAYYPADEANIAIHDIDLQRDVRYRSLYRPDTLAIDTFYTSFSPILLQND